MKKLSFIFILGMIVCSFGAFGQLTISSDGNVGIDAPGALSRFSIGSVGASNSKVYISGTNTNSSQNGLAISQALTNSGWTYATNSSVAYGTSDTKAVGLRGSAYKSTSTISGTTIGTLGIAGNAQAGSNYGVWGQLLGSNYGAAIFATVPGKSEIPVYGMYAGYFRGDVYVENNVGIGMTNPTCKLAVYGDINATGYVRSNGVVLTSDSTMKTDIQALANGNLSKLNSLKVVTFKYEQPDLFGEKNDMPLPQDTGKVEASVPSSIPDTELYQQTQIGLLAQDLQKVYPDLVIADKQGTLGINYSGLVAVLVAAVKEQQIQIEELKSLIKK